MKNTSPSEKTTAVVQVHSNSLTKPRRAPCGCVARGGRSLRLDLAHTLLCSSRVSSAVCLRRGDYRHCAARARRRVVPTLTSGSSDRIHKRPVYYRCGPLGPDARRTSPEPPLIADTVADSDSPPGGRPRWRSPRVSCRSRAPASCRCVPGYVSFVTGEPIVDGDAGRAGGRSRRCCCSSPGSRPCSRCSGRSPRRSCRSSRARPARRGGGVVVVAFGLLLIGYALGRGSLALYAERRPVPREGAAGHGRGRARSGMAFAAGWTPCIGPVLGSILFIAAAGSTARGRAAARGYSLGSACRSCWSGSGSRGSWAPSTG